MLVAPISFSFGPNEPAPAAQGWFFGDSSSWFVGDHLHVHMALFLHVSVSKFPLLRRAPVMLEMNLP